MIDVNAVDALNLLYACKHSWKTNISKGKLSNRDAIAIVLFKCGPTSGRKVREMLSMWRYGSVTMTESTKWVDGDNGNGHTVPYKYFGAFNDYFNFSYGHLGKNAMSRGQKIVGWNYSLCDRFGDPRKNKQFRRHYWFRMQRGTYAITLEGIRRMHELNVKAPT